MNNAETPVTILIAEDNESMRTGMAETLAGEGYRVVQSSRGDTALELMETHHPGIIITDYKMPGATGLDVLKKARRILPDTEVIIITAYGTVDIAVDAMKSGAWDFISKPFSGEELCIKVRRAAESMERKQEAARLRDENTYLRREQELQYNYGEIIGESSAMQEVYRTIEKVAGNNTSVLILGESGTGKELAARAIHFNGPRRDKPFVKVNCGALARGVLESELFGHEKGAFTGAVRRKKGRFELAHNGTLFLDEIGELHPETQVKLLRVLQEREFERVGGEDTISVDVRIIAATNKDLQKQIAAGSFREDLYYRLCILPITLPPLRERKEDIAMLARHFCHVKGADAGKHGIRITSHALQLLEAYTWPGNVRELQNIIERALVLCEGSTVAAGDLSFIHSAGLPLTGTPGSMSLPETVRQVEINLIGRALSRAGNVKARAARLLGIKESTLYYKMEKLNIQQPHEEP